MTLLILLVEAIEITGRQKKKLAAEKTGSRVLIAFKRMCALIVFYIHLYTYSYMYTCFCYVIVECVAGNGP